MCNLKTRTSGNSVLVHLTPIEKVQKRVDMKRGTAGFVPADIAGQYVAKLDCSTSNWSGGPSCSSSHWLKHTCCVNSLVTWRLQKQMNIILKYFEKTFPFFVVAKALRALRLVCPPGQTRAILKDSPSESISIPQEPLDHLPLSERR